MLIGVDTYSYHRQLGELRDGELPPPRRWSHDDLLDAVIAAGAEVVSLETCFLPDLQQSTLAATVARLRDSGVEPVFAWGHPDGLAGGHRHAALRELEGLLGELARLEVSLLRIVVGGPTQWQSEPEEAMVTRLRPQLSRLNERAAEYGVQLAVETHCELTLTSFAALIEVVPELGVVLDTGNVIRVGSTLGEAVRLLGARVVMVHAKDLSLREVVPGAHPAGRWYCTAVGDGAVPVASALRSLTSIGFEGAVCVELMELDPLIAEDERAVVEQSLRTLRTWRDELSLDAQPAWGEHDGRVAPGC